MDVPAIKYVYGMVGIGAFLSVVFVILKLAGLIAWSWWWTISPLWIPMAAICSTPFLYVFFLVVFGRGRGGRGQ